MNEKYFINFMRFVIVSIAVGLAVLLNYIL